MSEQRMSDVQVLKEYRYANLEIQALQAQIGKLTEALNHPEKADEAVLETALYQMDECKRELAMRVESLGSLVRRFNKLIDSAGDERMRTVLRYYYAVGWTDEQIAVSAHLSTRTVNQLRNTFLRRHEAMEAMRRKHAR